MIGRGGACSSRLLPAFVFTDAIIQLSICRRFARLDIFAFCEIYSRFAKYISQNGKFDMLSLRCEPPKLILRSGEPQPLKLDMI